MDFDNLKSGFLIFLILLAVYLCLNGNLSTLVKTMETMCGGKDQGCVCDGNEIN